MSQVTGTITKVVDGKEYDTKFGKFKNQNVTIKDSEGNEVTVQRGAKPESNGQGLVGKTVQCSYDISEIETRNGTMVVNKTDSKRFILEQQGGSFGYQKGNSPSTSSNTNPSPQRGFNNSEGQRHGMIVNNAVQLAGLRKDLSLDSLLAAARDVIVLTTKVESGVLNIPEVTEPSVTLETKKPIAKKAKIDTDSPF